jgi:adenine/guanine phosphoribosyltransferase-like PRPP-binding protein
MVKKLGYVDGCIIILVLIIHFAFLNGLEKMLFSHTAIPMNYLLRPSDLCQQIKDGDFGVGCLGMPSGHAEIATILSYLLYRKKYLSWKISLVIVLLVCLQRVVATRHTILQVVMGVLFGFGYGILYEKTRSSVIYLLVTIGFVILLTVINMSIIDYRIKNAKIPEWVDVSMYDSIQKKQNVSFFIKFISVITPSVEQSRILFIEWPLLEIYLENVVAKIRESGVKYDCVVGIKTGGAILSGYLSHKLGIPNYKMKVSTIENNCNKTDFKSMKTQYEIYLKKEKKEYMVCEEISEDLMNKNVILIDEFISTGGTMRKAMDYLLDEKKVKDLYVCTINTNNEMDYRHITVNYERQVDKNCFLWPWGYDN